MGGEGRLQSCAPTVAFPGWQTLALCRPLKPFVVKPAQNWIVQMYREAQGICLSLKFTCFPSKYFLKSYLNFCGLEKNPYVNVGISWFLLAKKYCSTRTGFGSPLQIFGVRITDPAGPHLVWTPPVVLLEMTNENFIRRDSNYIPFPRASDRLTMSGYSFPLL